MYFNNLKRLRHDKELTQENVANMLKCHRSSYNNWERSIVMIPLDVADRLSLFYKVRLSYLLGLEKDFIIRDDIKKMNYNMLLKNLHELKEINKNTYDDISEHLKCTRATAQRYFKGVFRIPIDRLVLLSEFYEIDLDQLCNK